MPTNVTAAVRMYRLGELGDCFLVTFASNEHTSRMLIDCGTFRNSSASKARLAAVVKDIGDQLDQQPLDVVVGTHQHNDHLSGFVHCEKAFREMGVGEVWFSWLDDPRDGTATSIGAAHKRLRENLARARTSLQALGVNDKASRSAQLIDEMLQFQGIGARVGDPIVPSDAVKILKSIGKREVQYLRPGRILDMPGMPADSVRIHVLGPPQDQDLLYRKDPRTGESYDPKLATAAVLAGKVVDAVNLRSGHDKSPDDAQYPFNDLLKRRNGKLRKGHLGQAVKRYNAASASWRRIDHDWLDPAAALAVYMDSYTNNSSLVLAIELVQTGKVLLFAADAQVGNWQSWKDVKWERSGVKTDDLLARTILYKVGHHGSHNATLVQAFEKMTNPNLSALLPVDKTDQNIARPKSPWQMPAHNLMAQLVKQTKRRVLRMDGADDPDCDPGLEPAKGAWKEVGIKPDRDSPLFVELVIQG